MISTLTKEKIWMLNNEPCYVSPKATKAKHNLQSRGNYKGALDSSHYLLEFLCFFIRTMIHTLE